MLDFHLPILAGEKFLFVQPGVNPAFGVEALVELADDGLVLRRVAEEDAEFAGFGHEGASRHFERDSVTGLILSVKRDLSTGKVRRISSPLGPGGCGDKWIIRPELNQKDRKFKCYNFADKNRGEPW